MISSQGCRWLILFKKELIRLWNSILPEPGQPSAQLSKLIRLTACKKTKHTVSRWYRIVYVILLVVSYDTHKGKRFLSFDPPKPEEWLVSGIAGYSQVLLVTLRYCWLLSGAAGSSWVMLVTFGRG